MSPSTDVHLIRPEEFASCQHLVIPQEVCRIRFGQGEAMGIRELPFRTARGETVIAEFDAAGRLLSLELVGGQQPCQRRQVPVDRTPGKAALTLAASPQWPAPVA